MNHELGEYGRTLVRESSVPQDESPQLFEFVDGEVRRQRGLHSFFADDSDAHVRLENHSDIVAAITN